MTIARDRWQPHLKTRGQHYHDGAEELQRLHTNHPEVGADVAALGLHAFAEVIEWSRGRASPETSTCCCVSASSSPSVRWRRASPARPPAPPNNELNAKADRRFDAKGSRRSLVCSHATPQ